MEIYIYILTWYKYLTLIKCDSNPFTIISEQRVKSPSKPSLSWNIGQIHVLQFECPANAIFLRKLFLFLFQNLANQVEHIRVLRFPAN